MGIKTVAHPPCTPDLAHCGFWLFPKLKGCLYETIEEMKETATKVIDILTQEDFPGDFQKFSERWNKCIAAGGDYFEEEWSFMCVPSKKCPYEKKSLHLFNEPRIYSCVCEREYLPTELTMSKWHWVNFSAEFSKCDIRVFLLRDHCHIMFIYSSLPYYLIITGDWITWFIPVRIVSVLFKFNRMIEDSNSVRRNHFLRQ